MIKLIASDIDGTLLLEGMKALRPELYNMIQELKKHNIHFVAASGRQLESLYKLFSPVADDISYIAENGAICMHQGKNYVISEFERDFAMRIITEVEKCPNCKLAVSTPNTQYIKNGDANFYEYMSNQLSYNITAIDSFESIDEPIVKIAFHDTVTTQTSYEHFQTILGKEIKIANAGNSWIDFIPYDSNKGTALKFILEEMNLTAAEAISFGDQQNDIEMLEYAGTSYAMAHTSAEIQRHATNITESVERILKELLKTHQSIKTTEHQKHMAKCLS